MSDNDQFEEELERSGLFRCWCGMIGQYDEMFDMEIFEQDCGGSGVLNCECGGDICTCHNHGEVQCPGCPDCEEFDEDMDDYDRSY